MGFFDNKDHRPPSTSIEVGESVEGVITHLGVSHNLEGKLVLMYGLDGAKPKFAPLTLWRTLADARVDAGDRVRITRGPDEDRGAPSPAKTWTVERLAPGPTTRHPLAADPQPYGNPPAAPAMQVPAW